MTLPNIPSPERFEMPEDGASLYHITEAEIKLNEIIEDATNEETGEIDIDVKVLADRLQLNVMGDDAVESLCKSLKNMELRTTRIEDALAEKQKERLELTRHIDDEVQRLWSRHGTQQNRIQKYKDLILYFLNVSNRKTVDTGTFRATRVITTSTEVTASQEALEAWPPEYVRIKREADKKALKTAFKTEPKTYFECLRCGNRIEAVDEPLPPEWEFRGNTQKTIHHCPGNHVGSTEIIIEPPAIPEGVTFPQTEGLRIK